MRQRAPPAHKVGHMNPAELQRNRDIIEQRRNEDIPTEPFGRFLLYPERYN
jgi:hypothetical protein